MAHITIYPTSGTDGRSNDAYVGTIEMPKSQPIQKVAPTIGQVKTFIILDRSGSMGQNVIKIVNRIIPNVLTQLKYGNEPIQLITFGSNGDVRRYEGTCDQFRNNRDIYADGQTYMRGALQLLHERLRNCPVTCHNIRILAISDGDLHDQVETLNYATMMNQEIKQRFKINAQTIRYFTSNQQPDTRGLASVLQFNNIGDAQLLDIRSESDDHSVVQTIAQLFCHDGLDLTMSMQCPSKCLLSSPWNQPTDKIYLSPGQNIVWFSSMPSSLQLNDNTVVMIHTDHLTNTNFETLLKPKLDYYLNRLKILKVINTEVALNEITQILDYFTKLEQSQLDITNVLLGAKLDARISYFKDVVLRRRKSIVNQMAQIANDDKIAQLNSAQQAEYLRKVDVSQNSKGLARRALNTGIDFTSIVKEEVKMMSQHLSDLNGIDDSTHNVSFYSQETTLNGIKAVCRLVDEGMLDDMEATDILQLINIVGIACNGVIGDYPDPMTWRVNHLFPNCFISVSDITMAHIQSHGQRLHPPGFDTMEITNTIPVFDDPRIQQFLIKYAPNIIEYSASIGMRRLITGVNMTNGYTVCAGLWKMFEILNSSKSSLNVQTFQKLVITYDLFVGKYFDRIIPLLVDQDERFMYYNGNNGITNIIHPIYKLLQTKQTKHIGDALRSAYSFEAYQLVRKILKKHAPENKKDYAKSVLYQLLGVDFIKYGTPTTPLFEHNPEPTFYNKYHLNEEILQQYTANFAWLDYAVLIPLMIQDVMKTPTLDDQLIQHVLELDYDIKTFKCMTLIQSLLYHEKKDRVNDTNNGMKICDLKHLSIAQQMVQEYLITQYREDYQKKLDLKSIQENANIAERLVTALIFADKLSQFVDLLANGYTYLNKTCKITNINSPGFQDLNDGLLNLEYEVPERLAKLRILLLGKSSQHGVIWNGGNILRTSLHPYEEIFKHVNAADEWKDIVAEYMKHNIHIYRASGKPNRSGHQNDHPSFWAYGYMTLEDMKKHVSREVWEQYIERHVGCCGL